MSHVESEQLPIFDLWREADLITRCYCELNNLPVPERLKYLKPEELDSTKEKVKKELGL